MINVDFTINEETLTIHFTTPRVTFGQMHELFNTLSGFFGMGVTPKSYSVYEDYMDSWVTKKSGKYKWYYVDRDLTFTTKEDLAMAKLFLA